MCVCVYVCLFVCVCVCVRARVLCMHVSDVAGWFLCVLRTEERTAINANANANANANSNQVHTQTAPRKLQQACRADGPRQRAGAGRTPRAARAHGGAYVCVYVCLVRVHTHAHADTRVCIDGTVQVGRVMQLLVCPFNSCRTFGWMISSRNRPVSCRNNIEHVVTPK